MEDFAKPILDLFCSCFGQELDNNVELEQNLSTLTGEMAQLRTVREQLQGRVDFAEERLRLVRTPEVARWLQSADDLEGELAEIEGEVQAAREPLPRWWHAPRRWWGRVQLSSRVANKLRQVQYLQRYAEFDSVAERPRSAPPSLVQRRVGGNARPGSVQ